jgi:hypothetical protein
MNRGIAVLLSVELGIRWGGGGGQHQASAAFTLGKDLVPIVQEAGWVSEPVWIGAENLGPYWGSIPGPSNP